MSETAFTTHQTIGPFFHDGLRWAFVADAKDATITLTGRVLDGSGTPVSDAMLEAWRPGAALSDVGLLRVATDKDGRYSMRLPAARSGEPLAHICVFARGLLNHYFTAVFDEAGIDGDLWAQIPEARRATLLATPINGEHLQWDVKLQGDNETVFFDYR
ncbi:MAG: protocatechuate 3,4-dioxygenase [Burkholderiales bacterium]|nr:MAG: protocatechuate 3,4-dioxygenase [Burkholderiales bacterium]TAG47897.1 MAG: protocatechuate 3,4-dioxygenase [Betaproteobacteria bacterium]